MPIVWHDVIVVNGNHEFRSIQIASCFAKHQNHIINFIELVVHYPNIETFVIKSSRSNRNKCVIGSAAVYGMCQQIRNDVG